MKNPILAVILAFTLPAIGQTITADLSISQGGASLGVLTLEFDHLNTPMATANFIGLASGELPWIDSSTGVVQFNTPYYNGIKIHRVAKGFVSQLGSQKGDGTDGPGYSFPDEPDLGNLTHSSAYVLSMANSGPNTNGSQIFITAAATSFLDSKHIVFGKVATGSQALADTINCVPVVDFDGADNIDGNNDDDDRPVTDVIIDSVTVNYNGVSFDPKAQGLPVVSSPKVTSLPAPSSTEVDFVQPPRSLAALSYSTTLSSWTSVGQSYLDSDETGESSFPLPGAAIGNATQFFAPSLVTYDAGVLFPSDLVSRTLATLSGLDPVNPISFTFDDTGSAGTWNYSTGALAFNGPFTVSLFAPDGYGGLLVIEATGLNPGYFVFKRLGFDSSNTTFLTGRHTGTAAQNSFFHSIGFVSDLSGIFSLTR